MRLKESTSKLRWLKIELLSLSTKITNVSWTSSSSARHSREKSAKMLISSSTMSSTSNGMTIFSKLRVRMHKPSELLRDNIKWSLRRTIKNSMRSFHWPSSSAQNYWTTRESRPLLLSKRSKYISWSCLSLMNSLLICSIFILFRYAEAHQV